MIALDDLGDISGTTTTVLAGLLVIVYSGHFVKAKFSLNFVDIIAIAALTRYMTALDPLGESSMKALAGCWTKWTLSTR